MVGKTTGSSGASGLSPLQRDVLRAFFDRERGFFLSGGAALAGYHLHHRVTDDLDLFTLDDGAFERASHVMADLAPAVGAALVVRQDAPGFKRYAIERADERLIVDLVRERTPQVKGNKPIVDGIAVDPIDEILANKLTALVGRAEERDLVDLMHIERSGIRVESALAGALAKDGGCTPAALAWVLSQWEIPDGARLAAGSSPAELREFVADLVVRLRRAAAPRP